MKNDKYAYPAHIDSVGGLSRRELFAAMAMEGLCANKHYYGHASDIPHDAVAIADGVISELDK